MSGDYGQFCPVAKAAQIIDERWTLLVIRELLAGSGRFNDIHRGVPRMSRSLLAARLRSLVRDGLVERIEGEEGPRYELSAAGEEFRGVVDAMGEWGVRWMSSLSDEDFDPAFLLWDMQRSIDTDALPDGQTVLELSFDGVAQELRGWWLLLSRDEVDVCDHDPGVPTDVLVTAPIRIFVDVWRGQLSWADALRSGSMTVEGVSDLRRELPAWLRLSHFAHVSRPPAPPRHV